MVPVIEADAMVRVRLFAAAKAAAGVAELDVAPGTIGSISDGLIATHAQLALILPACSFLINGMQSSQPAGLAVVESGSVLDVLPPFAGG